MRMERKKKKSTIVPTAQRLRQVRQDLHLSQVIFGRAVGVSQAKMSALEQHDPLSKVIALAIEHVYGIRAEWLLTGKEPTYTADGPRLSGGTDDSAFEEQLLKRPDLVAALQEVLGLTTPPQPTKPRGRKRRP